MLDRIADDAKAEGMDFIQPKIINTVIQHVFSKRGALMGIPYFVMCYVKGFGRWIPDQKGVKLRQQYYVERKVYKKAFSKRLRLNRAILKRTKAMYWKYWHTTTSERKMGFKLWKIASGRKALLDQKYRELNKIRTDFMKKEKNKFNYITIRKVKRKKNWR